MRKSASNKRSKGEIDSNPRQALWFQKRVHLRWRKLQCLQHQQNIHNWSFPCKLNNTLQSILLSVVNRQSSSCTLQIIQRWNATTDLWLNQVGKNRLLLLSATSWHQTLQFCLLNTNQIFSLHVSTNIIYLSYISLFLYLFCMNHSSWILGYDWSEVLTHTADPALT